MALGGAANLGCRRLSRRRKRRWTSVRLSELKFAGQLELAPRGNGEGVRDLYALPGSDGKDIRTVPCRPPRLSLVARRRSGLGVSQCGEPYFEEREVRNIQRLLTGLDKQALRLAPVA